MVVIVLRQALNVHLHLHEQVFYTRALQVTRGASAEPWSDGDASHSRSVANLLAHWCRSGCSPLKCT